MRQRLVLHAAADHLACALARPRVASPTSQFRAHALLPVIASANSLGPDRVAILHAPAPWSCTRLLITSRAQSLDSESQRAPRSFRAHATAAGDHFSQLTWSRPSSKLACSRDIESTHSAATGTSIDIESSNASSALRSPLRRLATTGPPACRAPSASRVPPRARRACMCRACVRRNGRHVIDAPRRPATRRPPPASR